MGGHGENRRDNRPAEGVVKISVVMAVYNGARDLKPTLDSILGQTERDFELIAVDDGSTDDTPSILAAYAAKDDRIRVITQTNAGLTRALIRGCAEARASLIARHDCGDRSHPERFARQLERFGDPGVVLVASATRFVSPEGELLYVVERDGEEARRSLLHDTVANLKSIPSHPSAMFRSDAYRAAGGYREQFRVGQDIDLWVRMARLGRFVVLPEELYEATFHPSSISGGSRAAQLRVAEIILALRDGGDEAALLGEASRLAVKRGNQTPGLYFIARCLRARRNPAARRYLVRTLRRNPFHWRAWISILTGR
jgi:glycosyltransferase involved in cell wall biosynthesis